MIFVKPELEIKMKYLLCIVILICGIDNSFAGTKKKGFIKSYFSRVLSRKTQKTSKNKVCQTKGSTTSDSKTRKSSVEFSCTKTTQVSVGPVSASKSKDGTKCGTFYGVSACSNSKTGEKSFGVSGGGLSLMQGGKGSSGKNNFVKVSASAVSRSCSMKIRTPSFTRSGMTTGSIKNIPERKK